MFEFKKLKKFYVEHKPIPRPEKKLRGFKIGHFCKCQAYTPKDHPVNGWKEAIETATNEALKGDQYFGPVALGFRFYLPRPMNHISTKKTDFPLPILRASAPTHLHMKPDTDNLLKCTIDAMKDIGAFAVDDSQACILLATKEYGDEIGLMGVLVEIAELHSKHTISTMTDHRGLLEIYSACNVSGQDTQQGNLP